MGLGGGPSEWDDYEWVRLADLPGPPRRPASAATQDPPPASRNRKRTTTKTAATKTAATKRSATRASTKTVATEPPPARATAEQSQLDDVLTAWLAANPLWDDDGGVRLLLADLDNLRADPTRWRARMAAVVALARGADHVAMAGQTAAVERARPHLAEFADAARGVADGSDLADFVLLAAADAVHLGAEGPVQAVVVSNDNIFAGMADWGPLTVLSPGADALSERLRDAAGRVVDLVELEQAPAP